MAGSFCAQTVRRKPDPEATHSRVCGWPFHPGVVADRVSSIVWLMTLFLEASVAMMLSLASNVERMELQLDKGKGAVRVYAQCEYLSGCRR